MQNNNEMPHRVNNNTDLFLRSWADGPTRYSMARSAAWANATWAGVIAVVVLTLLEFIYFKQVAWISLVALIIPTVIILVFWIHKIKPLADPASVYPAFRPADRCAAWAKVTWAAITVVIVLTLLELLYCRPDGSPSIVKIIFTTMATCFLIIDIAWVVLVLSTKFRVKSLTAIHVSTAQLRRQELLKRIRTSMRSRAHILVLLADGKAINESAETEFRARRFTVFWDRIEEAAKKWAELQNAIDDLRSQQQEYNNRLRGFVHNFPAFLPGCSPVSGIVLEIDRYYTIVRRAQADIDFALIWEHRKTRESILNTYESMGELINNTGISVRKSLQHLIEVTGAPRYSVGFIQ